MSIRVGLRHFSRVVAGGKYVKIEKVDWGYFKKKGEIWFNEEQGSYFKTGAISFMVPLQGVDALGQPRGGGYFGR